MGADRENTLVVDFSVLPKRPDASAVEKFMYGELKLDLADVVNIQFHNVRNLVYVEMVNIATATRYHISHHLQRVMKVDKQEFKIPVYVEDGAVNVRIHDFPPRTANTVLKEHMQQFGTILSISREKWKNHFPGVYNGVRVVRMRLTKPIPSYQTIDGETTLVTYPNQTKTCKYCGRKAHPRQKCKSNTAKDTDDTNSAKFAALDFPTLGDDQQKQQQQPFQRQQRKQPTTGTTVDQTAQQTQSNENNNSDVEWIESDSDEALTNNNKRRLSTKREENELKRKTANQGYQKHDGKRTDQDDNNQSESSDPPSPAVTRSKNKKSGKNG